MTTQSDINKLAEQIAGSISSFANITAWQNRPLSSIYPIFYLETALTYAVKSADLNLEDFSYTA
ncbi:hypothetical protein [Psychrobacter glacincola]|uniref:Uncharacterized protein n=1 Tax=Psychrobacter glacincola TaxID=56810 RepID=A0ABW1W8Y9_9GAMM|nr:hypothetical protein [Psychrobacter glacincola]